MGLMTISQISKTYQVTTRTLRYYEEIGLLSSVKKDDYAYRTYDEPAVRRLQQILLLRKLRIKLQDIARILDDPQAVVAIDIFEESLHEVTQDIKALDTIRSIYEILLQRLKETRMEGITIGVLETDLLMQSIQSLPFMRTKLKEEKASMMELNKANESFQKLRDEEVRILYVPPYTVASAHYIGESPEDHAQATLNEFINESNLLETNPEARVFGFNNPTPKQRGEVYGYEFWVTIPEGYAVPEPLDKKMFEGGLYAVYCIKMGEFDKWQLFWRWVEESKEFEYNPREPLGMDGALEEHLNAYMYYEKSAEHKGFIQLDLMIPIRKRSE